MDEELIELTTKDVIELELEEVVESEVSVEDLEYDVDLEDAIKTVDEIEIEMSEAVGWTGGDSTRHYSLYGRDEPNQHPIKAITGLRDELDEIKSLKTVYSDKTGVANYYAWNEDAYDGHGYFVSLVPHTTAIKLCTGKDIFGVTVDAAGFVGNQNATTPREKNNAYALVVTSGLVDVRCESTVIEGDYVISNAKGVAEKTTSGCGYKVIAVNDDRTHDPGVLYATIVLGVQACTTDALGKSLQHLETRVGNNETNITAAMNVANDAYNKSVKSDSVSEEAVLKALEALSQASGAVNATDEMNQILESVNNAAVQAKAIAEGAVTKAESIRKEAYDTANDALTNVNDLIGDLKPITQWEDPISGNTGAEYLTTYINDGLATKVEVQTTEKATEENKLAISKNAENLQTLISSVDKYSVGEYSQAYGLTLEQARSILKEGMIYIPTPHGEAGTHSEAYKDGENEPLEREFTQGYYYEWAIMKDGATMWSEKLGEVWFGTEQPAGDTYTYWYDGNKLCLLNNSEWIEVATLAGNVNNRISSMIRQDVDSVTAEVVNARAGAASLSIKLSNTDATVNTVASWKDSVYKDVSKIASIEQKANDNSASIGLVVTDGKADGSLIIGAINGESVAKIEADRLDIEGKTLNIKVDATNVGGTLTIGQLPSTVAETSDIPTKTSDLTNDSGFQNETGVVTIAKGAINADHIKTLNLEVGNQIQMGANAKISWENVTEKDEVATTTNVDNAKTEAINAASSDATSKANDAKSSAVNEVKNLGYQTSDQVTTITKNEISTATIRADQINVTDLNAFGATVGGWELSDKFITKKTEAGEMIGLYSGEDYAMNSLISDQISPIRFFCGVLDESNTTINTTFCVLADGSLYATAAKFSGKNVVIDGNVVMGSSGESVDTVVGRVPINTSDLVNDSGFVSESKVQELIDAAINSSGSDNGGSDNSGSVGDYDNNSSTQYVDDYTVRTVDCDFLATMIKDGSSFAYESLVITGENATVTETAARARFPITIKSTSTINQIDITCSRACTLTANNEAMTSGDNLTHACAVSANIVTITSSSDSVYITSLVVKEQ